MGKSRKIYIYLSVPSQTRDSFILEDVKSILERHGLFVASIGPMTEPEEEEHATRDNQ